MHESAIIYDNKPGSHGMNSDLVSMPVMHVQEFLLCFEINPDVGDVNTIL